MPSKYAVVAIQNGRTSGLRMLSTIPLRKPLSLNFSPNPEGLVADIKLKAPRHVITIAAIKSIFLTISGDEVINSSNLTAIQAYGYSTRHAARANLQATLIFFWNPS